MPIKAIIKDQEMLAQLTAFVRAYNQRLIVDRQLTVEAIVVQALADIYYNPEQTLMGEQRDLSVQNIYDKVVKLMGEFDLDEKLSPRKIGGLLIALGLPDRERKHDGRSQVLVPEAGFAGFDGPLWHRNAHALNRANIATFAQPKKVFAEKFFWHGTPQIGAMFSVEMT